MLFLIIITHASSFTHTEIHRAIALTPLANFMRPNETVTMRPTKDAHVRPAALPQAKCRVLLLGECFLLTSRY